MAPPGRSRDESADHTYPCTGVVRLEEWRKEIDLDRQRSNGHMAALDEKMDKLPDLVVSRLVALTSPEVRRLDGRIDTVEQATERNRKAIEGGATRTSQWLWGVVMAVLVSALTIGLSDVLPHVFKGVP